MSTLETFSDVLFCLENHGLPKDLACRIATTCFQWGVSAAIDRMRPARPVPTDAPQPTAEQADAIAATPAPTAPKKKSSRAMVQRRIPDDFELTAERSEYATGRGFSRQQAAAMFESFVGYYRQTGKKWADWDATWQGWVRRQVDRNNQQRGPDDRGGGFL
jgi:hypothetical protein